MRFLRLFPNVVLMCILLAGGVAGAGEEQAEDPMAPVADVAGLPRVLLIGDSISIGYTLPVRALLSGKANVHRIPENAATTARGLERIEVWLGEGHWDVIHFNWGLHDLKHERDGKGDLSLPCLVPLADYERNLTTLVERLKQTGAKLIWASTTVVPEGEPRRLAADLPEYNAAALRVMKAQGVGLNDLHAVSANECADLHTAKNNVHYTKAGYEKMAVHVAGAITRALAE